MTPETPAPTSRARRSAAKPPAAPAPPAGAPADNSIEALLNAVRALTAAEAEGKAIPPGAWRPPGLVASVVHFRRRGCAEVAVYASFNRQDAEDWKAAAEATGLGQMEWFTIVDQPVH